MKVGDTRSDEAMLLVASSQQYTKGYFTMKHVRNGLVVIERIEGSAPGADWVVTKCERPDK